MRKMMLVAGILLALCGSVAAEKKADEVAAERKAQLVENVKSFTLSLQYHGAQDPKVPRWSVVLSTQPIARLAIPAFNSDVVITEAQALKIIDRLEKDGFLAAAAMNMRADYVTPCYVLQVAGGGGRLEQGLGWDLAMFKRMDALAAVLEGDARKAADRIIAGVADVRATMEAAQRKQKLAGDLDNFVLWLNYSGAAQPKPAWSLVLSTQPREYSARSANSLDAVITKDEAKAIIDWLEKDGFFGRAQGQRLRSPVGPVYELGVKGGGIQLMTEIGWGDALITRLTALRGLVKGGAADTLDKFTATVKELMPPATGKSHEPAK
jgi:hypothetical protein